MRAIVVVAAVVAASPLTACVSMGRDFDPSDVAALRPGDSEQALIGKFGRPTTTVIGPDGNITVMWIYSHGNALGQGTGKSLMVKLGPDHKLIQVMSQATTEIGYR